jgi:hypothetical protein
VPEGFVDILPRCIYCEAKGGLFAESARSLEFLVERLENPFPHFQTADRDRLLSQFASLHRQFTEESQRLGSSVNSADFQVPQSRVLKTSNSFTTPPATEWSGLDLRGEIQMIWLGRWNDLECWIGRHLPPEFSQLAMHAGQLLPEFPDQPLMFTRDLAGEGELSHPVGCSRFVLNPAPVARWIRFVFGCLMMRKAAELTVTFHSTKSDPRFAYDLYGEALTNLDFFAASALAIELSGLKPPARYRVTVADDFNPAGCIFKDGGTLKVTKNQFVILKLLSDCRAKNVQVKKGMLEAVNPHAMKTMTRMVGDKSKPGIFFGLIVFPGKKAREGYRLL